MSEPAYEPLSEREQPPPAPRLVEDIADFPELLLPAGFGLRRAHTAGYGCWYFSPTPSGSPTGRFDLPTGGREPRGTCYAALDANTALGEKLGPLLLTSGVILAVAFDSWHIATITTRADHRLADLTRRSCVGYGVAGRELSVAVPYSVPQAWARRWEQAGLDGVFYYPRHDALESARSVALFGPAGGREADDPAWPEPLSTPARGHLPGFARAYALIVNDRPTLAEADTHDWA